jgi:hypothetical protein
MTIRPLHALLRTSVAASLAFLFIAATYGDVAHPAAGDSFQIESAANAGRLLRVKDARSENGTPIVLYPKVAWKCMTWQFEADGEGFRLRNHFTRKTLGPATKPSDASTPVVQKPLEKEPSASEAWRFEPVADTDGLVRLVHVESGFVLEANDDGGTVLAKPSDSPNQRWRLLPKPEKFTG